MIAGGRTDAPRSELPGHSIRACRSPVSFHGGRDVPVIGSLGSAYVLIKLSINTKYYLCAYNFMSNSVDEFRTVPKSVGKGGVIRTNIPRGDSIRELFGRSRIGSRQVRRSG